MKTLKFPEGFLWGASVSSYQVSGCGGTNWSEWEKSPARLVELEKSGDLEKYGLKNLICEDGCFHRSHEGEDHNLIRELGHNAFHFGAEPALIMPEKGIRSNFELYCLRKKVQHLKSLGIEPVFGLWHWTMPSWFDWLAPDALEHWEFYVRAVVEAVGEDVKYWAVLNETNCYSCLSYLSGYWPPQEKSKTKCLKVFWKLVRAYKIAYRIIKEANPEAQVGIAQNISWGKGWWPYLWNWLFLDLIKNKMDFVGINSYGKDGNSTEEGRLVSDLGWGLYPEAVYHTVKATWSRYHKPILVTENGLADALDSRRPWFLWESLRWLHKATEEGIPVIGYLHWSLMDNFEWAFGFWPRFGLVEIDREHGFARKPRVSAYLYRDIILANGLTLELAERYAAMIARPAGPIKE